MTSSPQHLDRLRLRHLRLLDLIDRHGSLRAVGAVLNLTQPAVSQMVKDLEFAFGANLIDRSVRGVTLSAAGQIALQRVRSGLASFDHLAEELEADQTLLLRIGTNSALMFGILPAALRRLGAGRSGPRYKLQTGVVGDMIHGLVDGELDCYVGRIDWDQIPLDLLPMLRSVPLLQTDLVLACPAAHPLAGRRDLSVHDLLEWPWAMPPQGANNRIALESALRDLGLVSPLPAVEITADPHALINLSGELNLLTCVPRLLLEGPLAAGGLRVLDLPDLRLPPIQIGFVTVEAHESFPPLQTFRQALIDLSLQETAGA